MLYVIHAYEGLYGGTHGMEDFRLFKGSESEAEAVAIYMSYDVMDSYNCIYSALEEQASEFYEEGTEEWFDEVESLREQDVEYQIFEVDTKNKTYEELAKEFNNSDPWNFIERWYCE